MFLQGTNWLALSTLFLAILLNEFLMVTWTKKFSDSHNQTKENCDATLITAAEF